MVESSTRSGIQPTGSKFRRVLRACGGTELGILFAEPERQAYLIG